MRLVRDSAPPGECGRAVASRRHAPRQPTSIAWCRMQMTWRRGSSPCTAARPRCLRRRRLRRPWPVQAAGADLGIGSGPGDGGTARSRAEPDAPATVGAELPSRRANAGIEWSRFVSGRHPPTGSMPPRLQPAASGAAVRVRAPLLDRLVNHAGEVSITRPDRADMGQMKGGRRPTENLERLRPAATSNCRPDPDRHRLEAAPRCCTAVRPLKWTGSPASRS